MILIVTQCFPPRRGGVEAYMGSLADAIAAAGAEIEVFADGPAAPEDAERAYPVRRFQGWKPLRSRAKAAALRARLADRAVEKIFFDSWKSLETALGVVAPSGAAAPRLITLAHGMEFPESPRPAKRRRVSRALGAADAILANSEFTARRAHVFAPEPARLLVTPPPIAAQPEATREGRAALSARLASAGRDAEAFGAPLIGGLARLEPRKGFDQLLRAAAALRPEHPALAVAIAGDGPDRERLQSVARESGARAYFLGGVSEAEKAALFAEARLFAMPTRAEGDSVEGFGLVYLEAGWHGTPALAGRDGGAGAAVIEGRTGWFCDGASEGDVAAALAAALSDPAELSRRGALAAEHARSQLWSARLNDYLDV